MERLDIYDYAGRPTGQTIDRKHEEELAQGQHFLIVHVCVFNSKGELLIQQRRKPGDVLDGCWDVTVAGHVHSGETSQVAAMREAKEEMGLHVDLTRQAPLMRLRFNNGFDDIYVLNEDVPIDSLRLQDDEVRAARYATREEVLALMHKDLFLPYMDSFIQCLFDMRKSNGFIREDRPDIQ